MIQTLYRAKRFLALVCVLLASLCILTPAFAQLDYDTYDIYQGGNLVGVIYVPQRGTKMPWGDGYHYVTVVAYDRTTRPIPVTTTTTAE